MSKTLDILLKLPSYVLHPFWIPTYGIALLFYVYFNNLPTVYHVWAIVGTFVLTALIPLLISILYVRNTHDSLMMNERANRIAPFIYTCFCYSFWCYFMKNGLNLPHDIVAIGYGATLALCMMTFITFFWKISAHLICFGGIIGGVLTICCITRQFSVPFITILFFLAIWLCCSRTYMKSHTPEQLAVGFIIGLLATFSPSFFM